MSMAAAKKVNMSSATRGNPYGRTGAPGKATEKKDEADDRDEPTEADGEELKSMMGRREAPSAPSPAEQRLQMAPPSRPQPMPNLQALQQRQMQMPRQPMAGGMPPGMPAQRPPMGMPPGGPQMPPPMMPPGQVQGAQMPPMDPARAQEMARLRAQYGG
jgi:hypothetical protein